MLVFVRIAGSFPVNLLKQGRIVPKPVNADAGLKVNQIITFSPVTMFLLLCRLYMAIIKTQNRRPNNVLSIFSSMKAGNVCMFIFFSACERAEFNKKRKVSVGTRNCGLIFPLLFVIESKIVRIVK